MPRTATACSVVVNGRFLRARPTGLHRVARRLLAAARFADVDLEVFAPAGTTDPLVDRAVWAPPGRAGQHIWEQVALPVAAGPQPLLSLANTAPVVARAGVVLVHDVATLVGPQWFRPELRLYGRLTMAAAKRARAVITVSNQVAGELSERGVPAERIQVIPNAVGPEFAPAAPAAIEEARARFGLEDRYVIMVGWADPRKDVATAVAAHRAVVHSLPHQLVLVGSGHQNFASVESPAGPGISILGYVPDATLPALLAGAAALLYPSRYEGFGLPPVEAMACGTPALVSDLPSIREATAGGAVYLQAGDVAVWADALRSALQGAITAGSPPSWTWEDAGRALSKLLATVAPS